MISIRREIIGKARGEGVPPEVARRIAESVCAVIRSQHGGSREYIPAPDVRERNRRIVEAKKSGYRHSEIAKKEGVHPATVTRVVAQEFGDEEWAL